MKIQRGLRWLGLAAGLAAVAAGGQQTAVPTSPGAAPDPGVEAAQEWMGRALILRGFYGGAEIRYDAQGRVRGAPAVVDWTLAGMNIDKVLRDDTGMLVLEGPRIAIRYNPDAREFQRHPQKDERLRVMLPEMDAQGVRAALGAIFAVGIDPAVERTTPLCWRHYFFPAMEWTGADNVGPVTVVAGATAPAGMVMPAITQKEEPGSTGEAQRDKVKGTVQVKVAVDVNGVPRQITIRQPLGYGLDARTVEAVARYRFTPGTKDGKPVAVEMIINQPFDVVGR